MFLFVYKFLDFSWESFLSSLAGIAAVVVAVFPTERPGDGITLTPFQVKLGEPAVTAIHYGAAIAFIALLIPIVLFFARDEGKRGHRNWQGFHTVSAAFIAFGAVLAAFAGITHGPDKGVLFGEWIAIWAFGAAWLAKGASGRCSSGARPHRPSSRRRRIRPSRRSSRGLAARQQPPQQRQRAVLVEAARSGSRTSGSGRTRGSRRAHGQPASICAVSATQPSNCSKPRSVMPTPPAWPS